MKTKAEYIAEHIIKWEGGWSTHPADSYACTMSGITIATYQQYFGKDKTCKDLKKLTEKEWVYIFKQGFYHKAKIDQIENWSLALLVCDLCWMSGPKTSIKKIQKVLGVAADGIIGPITLKALNDSPEENFYEIVQMREKWYKAIVQKSPEKKVFLRGWMNRLNSIKYSEYSDETGR